MKLKRIIRYCALIVFLAPLGIYFFYFPNRISTNHLIWAEFGTIIAGIYSPIVTALGAVIVFGQFRLQRSQLKIQDQSEKRRLDQVFIEQTRHEVEFYLLQLHARLLEVDDKGTSTRRTIEKNFGHLTKSHFSDQERIGGAKRFGDKYPDIISSWFAYYEQFNAFQNETEYPYPHTVSNSISKARGLLSYKTCVALDNCLSLFFANQVRFELKFGEVAESARVKQ
jgi:hypothetical protein